MSIHFTDSINLKPIHSPADIITLQVGNLFNQSGHSVLWNYFISLVKYIYRFTEHCLQD